MSQHFFNTINFEGEGLKREDAKCAKQEELILSLFKANPNKLLSPSQVHAIVGKKYQIYPPITSIRRALTNLTGRLELIKTDEMVPGLYHLPEHTWKLAGTSENLYQKNVESAGQIASKIISKTTVTQSELF
jgi:hypothetical protein